MARLTKAQQADRDEAIAKLREWLKPGTTIHTIQRHRAASGMMRVLDVYLIRDNEPLRITYSVADACGMKYNKKHEGIEIGGCGFNPSHEIAMSISYAIHGYPKDRPDGVNEVGEPWDRRYDTGDAHRAGYTVNYREM